MFPIGRASHSFELLGGKSKEVTFDLIALNLGIQQVGFRLSCTTSRETYDFGDQTHDIVVNK